MTLASDAWGGTPLEAGSEARLRALAAKGWVPPAGHPLADLHGKEIGPIRLIVVLGPKNNVGARYFQMFAADPEGRLSEDLLALGMFNSGLYPAFNWLELTHYQPTLAFAGGQFDIRAEGHELRLFELLSTLVPPGGHLMVEYDSPQQEATARILTLGYPPVTTPIGFRLFQAGVRSYRDWYISEGGREGPRKLQGFKPLNAEIEREKTAALLTEAQATIASPQQHGEWGEIARQNAVAVTQALGSP